MTLLNTNLTYHSTVVTGVGQVDDAPRGGALVVLLHYGTQELSLPEPAGRIVIVEILRILFPNRAKVTRLAGGQLVQFSWSYARTW